MMIMQVFVVLTFKLFNQLLFNVCKCSILYIVIKVLQIIQSIIGTGILINYECIITFLLQQRKEF